RRRHTRFSRDWSSDVCSSDLETVSNPLLEVADIRKISEIAHQRGIKVVVDNTFSPLSITPSLLGADVTVHSLTKYINGSSDTVRSEERRVGKERRCRGEAEQG